MIPSIQDLLKKYDLFAKKSLGQNFLLDSNITDKIARFGLKDYDASTDIVVEIGPGPAGLSRSLLNSGVKKLVVIEKDNRFIPLLQETFSHFKDADITILEEDATKVDWESIGKNIKVVANLPYNVATPILINFLHKIDLFKDLTLMFQKEVAQRIVAQPNSGNYGRLSIISQLLCEAQMLFTLPPEAFSPPPKIDSSVVRLVPKAEKTDIDLKKIERITATLFSQRRKMIRATLKQLGNPSEICEKTGINETLRPENLSISDICKIANVV